MRCAAPSRWFAGLVLVVLCGSSGASWGTWLQVRACATSAGSSCCCALAKAGSGRLGLPAGAACSMRRGRASCGLRSAEGAVLRSRTEAPLAKEVARLTARSLLPPEPPALRFAEDEGRRAAAPSPEPLTPPPRPA